MHSIFDLANWFLAKSKMTHKKLQKLCYYAQAWSCAIQPEPITNAEFEAWQHGPVCRELYSRYADYGFNWIEKLQDYVSPFTADEEDFLSCVWETYGDIGPNALEALTHTEMPWKKARIGLSPDERGTVLISREDMRDFYRSVYEGGTE